MLKIGKNNEKEYFQIICFTDIHFTNGIGLHNNIHSSNGVGLHNDIYSTNRIGLHEKDCKGSLNYY